MKISMVMVILLLFQFWTYFYIFGWVKMRNQLIDSFINVNCYSNSFIGRTVNAWNTLPASAFDFESVNSFKHFFNDCDLSQFLNQ